MPHSVKINLVSDQTIFLNGKETNIHDIESLYVNEEFSVVEVCLNRGDHVEWVKINCKPGSK